MTRRIAAAVLVAGSLAAMVAIAADAPPAPPVWVTAGKADAAVADNQAEPVAAAPDAADVPAATATPMTVPAAEAPQAAPPVAPVITAAPAPSVTQGLGCVAIGALTSVGVFFYGNTVAAAVTGGPNPFLLVPMMAAGFAVGCTVGARVSPSLHWLAGHII